MKTVIDAVNKFEGIYPYNDPSIIEQISTGNWDSWQDECSHGLNTDNFRVVCTRDAFNKCVEEMTNMNIKPVYTKEFRVISGNSPVWQKCKIVFVGKRYTVVENENGKEFSRKTSKIAIRDIDTRTDKEKAIDDLDRTITMVNQSTTDNYKSSTQFTTEAKTLLEVIKAGNIHGITWSGK